MLLLPYLGVVTLKLAVLRNVPRDSKLIESSKKTAANAHRFRLLSGSTVEGDKNKFIIHEVAKRSIRRRRSF
jgi:hypothetical protein